MADKKCNILEFVEQMNFEQMIPTQIFHHTINISNDSNTGASKLLWIYQKNIHT